MNTLVLIVMVNNKTQELTMMMRVFEAFPFLIVMGMDGVLVVCKLMDKVGRSSANQEYDCHPDGQYYRSNPIQFTAHFIKDVPKKLFAR